MKMKRAFWIFLAAMVAVFGRGVFATQTGAFSLSPASIFTVDDSDLWLYPAEINNYPNTLSLEMDSFPLAKDNMNVLGSWSDWGQKFGTFGIGYGDLSGQKNIEAVIAALNTAMADNPLMSPRNSIPLPENKYHFFYAKDIGTVVAGLHFSRASGLKNYDFSDSIPQDTVKRDANSCIWAIETGVSAIIGDNIYIQSGLGYQNISFSTRFELSGADPLYWEQIESSDGSAKRLEFRGFYGLNDKMAIVPIFSYSSLSLGYSAGYGDTIHTPGSLYDGTGGIYSQSEFKVAIGAEYRPQKNIKLLGGISLEYAEVDISDSSNVWLKTANPSQIYLSQKKCTAVLPGIQGGFEAGLLKWLKLRFGASQRPEMGRTESEFKNGLMTETSENNSKFNIYFGLGFVFGRLTIDAQLNEDQPYNLGYLMSGIPEVPFVRLSMKYRYLN